jgi:hypothetical protein
VEKVVHLDKFVMTPPEDWNWLSEWNEEIIPLIHFISAKAKKEATLFTSKTSDRLHIIINKDNPMYKSLLRMDIKGSSGLDFVIVKDNEIDIDLIVVQLSLNDVYKGLIRVIE